MDATRETVTVNIAGHEVRMLKPTADQLAGIVMIDEEILEEPEAQGEAVRLFIDLFKALLPSNAERMWFARQMIVGKYTVKDIQDTIVRIATAPADAPQAPKTTAPRAAKKTTARKATARR